jgi:hypothetical protein
MTRPSKIQVFAYYAFFPVILAFLFYVGFGYYVMISSQWPNWPGIAVFLLCLAIVAIIYFFVRHTGFAIYEASVSMGWRRFVWIPLFLLLFVFSGYGFLTSSMLLIEGPDIARDEMAALSANLGKLQTAARDLTNNATYHDFASALDYQRNALMHEIEASGHCGIGPQAHNILKNILDLASSYKIKYTQPSNANSPLLCSDTDDIKEYKRTYNAIFKDMDQSVRSRFQLIDRDTQDGIIENTKSAQESLNGIGSALVGVHYFFDLSFYHEVLSVISRAYGSYLRASQNLPGFTAERIDTGDLEHLGLFLYLPELVWTRLFVPPTILLCLLALFCDVLATQLVAAVLQRQRQLQDEQRLSAAAGRAGGKDVTYLWQPETHPLAPTGGARR